MLFKKILPNFVVEKRYVSSGANFGDAVSYIYMGECDGFEKLLSRWEEWEGEYNRRGFRTVSLDRFIGLGGYGKPIDDVIGQKREIGEEFVFHAKMYRENFLGKIKPVLDIQRLVTENKPQFGGYIPPSTECK